jgi:CheY-like chemotaxis protein
VKLVSLLAVPEGVVKEPPTAGEGRGVGRHEVVRDAGRLPREAIPPGVPSASFPSRDVSIGPLPSRDVVRFKPALPPGRPPASTPPQASSPQRTLVQTELLLGLGRLRQAFRDVAAVVEGVGALRSLGGEEALIEMAMFAQSHEQTVERVWRTLADCEEVARRVCTPPAPSVPASEDRSLTTDPAPMALEAFAEGDLEHEAPPEEEGPVTQVDAPQTRVLVVDDDPAVLRAFRRVLQAEHEIVTARDGSEALGIVLGGARVDAIICDIGMPKLDGPAFFSELFELRPHLMARVVFCTGGVPNEKTQRFLERLQAPLLLKPVAAVDLQRAVDLVRSR